MSDWGHRRDLLHSWALQAASTVKVYRMLTSYTAELTHGVHVWMADTKCTHITCRRRLTELQHQEKDNIISTSLPLSQNIMYTEIGVTASHCERARGGGRVPRARKRERVNVQGWAWEVGAGNMEGPNAHKQGQLNQQPLTTTFQFQATIRPTYTHFAGHAAKDFLLACCTIDYLDVGEDGMIVLMADHSSVFMQRNNKSLQQNIKINMQHDASNQEKLIAASMKVKCQEGGGEGR